MHLLYVDDSSDGTANVFVAIAIPARNWNEVFQATKDWRRRLNQEHKILLRKELHATKFVAGKGRLGPQVIKKGTRSRIFTDSFHLIESMPDVRVFGVCHVGGQFRAFERLLNRVNRTLQAWDSYGFLICDQGKEIHYTRLVRKMSVFNPIPSRYGVWPDGQRHRNLVLDRILEDPSFKDSKSSYLIQLADFAAYALLRLERPLASKNRYQIGEAYGLLRNSTVKECNRADPRGLGIIR